MATLDFLVELGTAELPPKSLSKLSKAFTANVVDGITAEFGRDAKSLLSQLEVKPYASPRRLAIMLSGLVTEIPGSENVVQGPPMKICYDAEGAPTKALIGFAKKNGVELSDLGETNGKVSVTQQLAAKPLEQLLPGIVDQALAKLPIAKRMRWGANKTEFVRPVQWLVMLFGQQVLDCTILGCKSGKTSRGHRFHHPESLVINCPADYENTLRKAYVIADYSERKQIIRQQVEQQASLINGIPQIDEELLDEVTGLNEWPVALTGGFDEEFLNVPQEALILSMKEHQKYFHTVDSSGKLMPNFITVSNIESKNPSKVISGNEKVIRPRLADAVFFFESDKKTTLESRCEKLKSIVFQKQLGTVYQKSERISKLAGHICELIGADAEKAARAAMLAKADLITDMVFEFTDLQGLMGYHYAINDGEDLEVAQAINEQYLPKFAGDDLPTTNTGLALALADRLDTLTGMFGINQPPTGSKDPFALRRATVGVMRIIIEKDLSLDIKDLVSLAVNQHSAINAEDQAKVIGKVVAFMLERLRAYYEDRNIRIDTYLAVAQLEPTKPLDFDQRINAVEHFRTLPAAGSLAAANKRVSNIIDKQLVSSNQSIDVSLLSETAEIALHSQLVELIKELEPKFAVSDYQGALTLLASLQEPIDEFFENVMVMADDQQIANNRILLLSQLRQQFLKIADISLLN